ncbi:MAG: hypothetical protein SGARI_001159 [Bacillariaceae sp.]
MSDEEDLEAAHNLSELATLFTEHTARNDQDSDEDDDEDDPNDDVPLESLRTQPTAAAQVTTTTGDGNESDDDWVFPTHKKYYKMLLRFMRYSNNVHYQDGYDFSKEELLAIRPGKVRRFLNYLAYKTPTPGTNDTPKFMRAESLKKAKGMISFFHPNKHVQWIEGRGGNPTQHRSITALIRQVKKSETRGQGAKA